jgi:hypothetical protein
MVLLCRVDWTLRSRKSLPVVSGFGRAKSSGPVVVSEGRAGSDPLCWQSLLSRLRGSSAAALLPYVHPQILDSIPTCGLHISLGGTRYLQLSLYSGDTQCFPLDVRSCYFVQRPGVMSTTGHGVMSTTGHGVMSTTGHGGWLEQGE